ncbi:MAG: hypothetical protein DHS20C21_05570 [Gemmatimonadota bacterium]|nr:MAG: hypothetical protein DHS20C21_05570 [Gemmatimonadota bacterium]
MVTGAGATLVGWAFALSAFAQGTHGDDHVAEDAAHGAADAAHGAADAAHASPNLFSVDPGLLIWTIVTFVIVLVVLRLTAWKPLMASLEERQRNIEGAIEDARKTKAEAERLLAKYESTMNNAKSETRAILEEARRDGKQVQEEIRLTAQKEAQEFKERAEREIELQKDAAKQEIWDLAGSLSTDLAGRILGRSINASDQERLVKELVDEMRRESGAGSA